MNKKSIKIAFSGVQSGGKTTTLLAVAGWLKQQGYKIEIVDEAARKAVKRGFKLDKKSNLRAQYYIFYKQGEKEMEAAEAEPDFILCDRSVYDALAYTYINLGSDAYLKLKDPLLLHGIAFPYDLILYFGSLSKIEDDGVRETDKHYQELISHKMEELMDWLAGSVGQNVKLVEGQTKDERFESAKRIIKEMFPERSK